MERKYRVVMTGISPLIMHHDDIDWADRISEARTAIKEQKDPTFAPGDDRCPPDTWKGCFYSDGTFAAIPTDNLRSCLMKAGAKVTLKNQETFKKATQSGIIFDEVFARFECRGKQIKIDDIDAITGKFAEQAAAVKALGFKLMVKRAKIGASKHVRVRPMFEQWTVTATFTVIDDRISEDNLQRIWQYAGMLIGLCDWRPDSPKSPGPYGRSSIVITRL